MKWYLKVIRDNYANFSGRARRQEFWMFYLFNFIFMFGLAIIFGIIAGVAGNPFIIFIVHIYMLATLIPTLAVVVRRLHDINKSGWNYFISLIPLVGPILLLVWLATEGDKGVNQYGKDPKKDVFASNEDIIDEDLLIED